MRETPSQYFSDHIHHLFAELNPEHVEQFYTSYQRWLQQQHIADLRAKIHFLQRHIAENNWRMQQVHPSPIALAILARLQSKGVTDIELLDRLLERGEIWLDQTMQHLEYCEQLDFMRDNYTEWCRNALDGAYDWIESIHDGDTAISPSSAVEEVKVPVMGTPLLPLPAGNTMDATEEALLEKLMSEEVEEEEAASMLETTLKIPLVKSAETLETPALDATPASEAAATVPTLETISSIDEVATIPSLETVSPIDEAATAPSLETHVLDTVLAIDEAQTEQHLEAAAPVEMAEAEQTVEAIAPVEIAEAEQTVEGTAPVEIAEAEQVIEAIAPVEMSEVEQPLETDVHAKEVDAGEAGEAGKAEEAEEVEQLQEAAVTIEEAPEEQLQEEETIIYFVDDLEMLPLEILAEPVGQEAELEQPDYVSMTEAWLPLEVSEDADASSVPIERRSFAPLRMTGELAVPTPEEVIPSELEEAEDAINRAPTVHEGDSPAYADTVPAVEVSGTSDFPVIENGAAVLLASTREEHLLSAKSEDDIQNDEVASPSKDISEDAWESEHQEFMPAAVEPLPASNDALWRWEVPWPSEANAPGDQGTREGFPPAPHAREQYHEREEARSSMVGVPLAGTLASVVSTQQSQAQAPQETQQKSPQKPTFLQRLFAIFWPR